MSTALARSHRLPHAGRTTTGHFIQYDGGADAHLVMANWYRRSTGSRLASSPGGVSAILKDYFPSIRTSSRIDWRDRTALSWRVGPKVLPVSGQVREIQAALSINKSELARILRVSRPTVYDWLNDGEPNVKNVSRIQQLSSLLRGAGASSADPLFPRFVRQPAAPATTAPIKLLSADPLDEQATSEALRRAKEMGEAIDRERREREKTLRAASFTGIDPTERKGNLATNVALMDWPHE